MSHSPRERSGFACFGLGAGFFLSSNVLGHGIGLAPDPRGGLLLTAAGLLCFVLAEAELEHTSRIITQLIQVILSLGCFSLVAALIFADLQEFRRVRMMDWGFVPRPQIIFATLYALASLAALWVFSAQKKQPELTEVPSE